MDTSPFPVDVDGGQAAGGQGSQAAILWAVHLWSCIVRSQLQWCFSGGGRLCGNSHTGAWGRMGWREFPRGRVSPQGGGGRQALCLAVLGGRWPRAPCPSTAPPGGLGQHWSPGVLWMSPESASPTGPAAWGGDFPAKIHDWHRELIQRWLKIKGSIILIKFHLF